MGVDEYAHIRMIPKRSLLRKDFFRAIFIRRVEQGEVGLTREMILTWRGTLQSLNHFESACAVQLSGCLGSLQGCPEEKASASL